MAEQFENLLTFDKIYTHLFTFAGHQNQKFLDHLSQHIEALIFACDQPITYTEVKDVLEETFDQKFNKPLITEAIKQVDEKYRDSTFAFELTEIAGGYQFLTKPAYHNSIGTYLRQTTKKRLSRAAMETLAITAYKQPVTKSELEKIRGVNCDYAMEKLLEKDLVEILGRRDGPGRPLIYGTSQKFMDYFGMKDLGDLPKLKEFAGPENTVGEAAPIEESFSVEANKSQDPNVRIRNNAVRIALGIADIIYGPRPISEVIETSEVDQNIEGSDQPGASQGSIPSEAILNAISVSEIISDPSQN